MNWQEGIHVSFAKDEAKQQLRECVDELRAMWETPDGQALSEAMTKHHFINRYIDYLGYRGLSDLELEHPVKNTGKFIDYALKIGGQLIFAVEAKPLGLTLSDAVGAQLLEYQVVENIEWGVATNARQVWVYYLYLQGPPAEKCVLKIDLLADDFDAAFGRLWLLSRESMSAGPGLRSLLKESQLEKALQSALLDKASKVVQALRADVRDRTQGKIKVTADEVVSWLGNRLARGLAPAASPTAEAVSAGPVPEGRRVKSFLKQMIERGIIPANAQVSAEHEGQEYTAVIDSEGHLLVRGERFRKPGFAAKRITGIPTDGLEFWTYNGVALARLREKLWKS
jgi:hypothetical protein